ncbi:MAG: hypothetical protein K0S61_2527 [Anaerocolumna sp.]|jgi:hypothetical protein|nr:hypothetical protein [Anaerocolumna sp.]
MYKRLLIGGGVVIQNYKDFLSTINKAGFSMGGGNDEGIYSVVSWNWNEEPPFDTPVRWHTGDRETDPWEWRMRVLEEDGGEIAYAKLFFKKSGYITKEWYPYFLATRRKGRDFEEEYADGTISYLAKRIYELFEENDSLPLHLIKQMGGFTKEDTSKFDRALVELQTKMYLTMCGRQQKVSKKGEEYGWSSTVFCTTESYFGEEVFNQALDIEEGEATAKITEQILHLNPNPENKKIIKFIKG